MVSGSLGDLIRASLQQSEELEDRVSQWQNGAPPSREEMRAVRDDYMAWFTKSLPLVAKSDRATFQNRYEGGMLVQRIRGFLTDPLAVSVLHNPDSPNPLVSPWQYPFDSTFRRSIEEQRDLLRAALNATASVDIVLIELGNVFSRLPGYLQVLEQAGSTAVPAPAIDNEADLQVLVEAILRLLYEDVRAEDPIPQRSGASSRADFFIREAGIIVETKMTRRGLTDRKLGEELAIDFERYQSHPGCRGVLVVVFDPGRRLRTPAALENDLTRPGGTPATRVVIVR